MTFTSAKASLQSSKPYGTYAGASAWLAAHTPAGARVFQTDWDDFPRLFYYNTHNTYLIGLDPTYLQLYDPELYRLWVEITRGEIERPSGTIERDFGAGYILTDLRHTGFLEQAAGDPRLVEVYRDGDAVIFQIAGAGPGAVQKEGRSGNHPPQMAFNPLLRPYIGRLMNLILD